MNIEQRPAGSPVVKLSKRNYFEIIASFLFFILGLIIFIRSLRETGFILGMGAGVAFLAYGIFRLRYIWRFFISRGQKS
jgi:Na+/H+ antiporter NhaD/arsenite permease-like protein